MKIAFVPKASDNPVFRVAFEGAIKAARELAKLGFKVDVTCLSPDQLDQAKQVAAIKQAIARQPHGIIMSCLDPQEIAPLIDDAIAKGIAVMTFDSDCPLSQRETFYGIDNEQAGMDAADRLVEAMFATGGEAKKSVAIVTGDTSADNLKRRESGFTRRLSDHFQDKVTLVATRKCNETADDCGGVVEKEITPDLDGLFITGLWGLQSACMCDAAGLYCTCDDDIQMPKWKAAAKGKLKTISYDTLPFELTLLKNGFLSTLISQDYVNWGHESVRLMVEFVAKKTSTGFVRSKHEFVGPEDVDRLQSKWQQQDFGAEPPPSCERP